MIPRQKCPGNFVLSILEYTGIYWNFISLLLYEPCYAVYRNTQTILRTWGAFSRSPMPIYAVGIAQMPSINTPTIRVHTRRDLRRSINAIMRVSGCYPAMSVCSSVVVAGDVSDGDLRHLPSVRRL